jgi:hypothetical protein
MGVKLGHTLGEEYRLWVSENRVLFGPKREEMGGGWRRLHNEELHNLYTSPNIIRVIKLRRMRWEGHVAHIGEVKIHKNFGWETLRKRPLGRHKRRWEDIRMGLRETG